jgi:ribosomal-protein-alanine N-acetyltransferase
LRRLSWGDLVLEPQTAAHASALLEVLRQPGVYDHLDGEPPELEAFTERLERLETRRSPDGESLWLNWVVEHRGEIVGYVQATVKEDYAFIAYVLGSRAWGRGIATAAVSLMIDELAANYEVRILAATVAPANAPSIRLLQRLGFKLVDEGAELLFERVLP